MSVAYLSHWSLDTGHQRRSARSKVSHEALAAMQEMLAFALAGGQPQIMVDPPATMTAEVVEGMGLIVTVWVGGDAVVAFGVAGDRTVGPGLWRRMHDERLAPGLEPPATNREKPPRVPWILERLEPGILRHSAPEHRLADFERCAGWAWLTRQYDLVAIKDRR